MLLLGAGPGKRDMSKRVPYSSNAGVELDNTYLSRAGFSRHEVHVGNASLCFDGSDRIPPEKRVIDCANNHLPRLLDRVQPDVVVLMGGVTTKLADKRIKLDMHRGRPQWNSLLGGKWEGWVWPSYEPALGLRETGKMTQLMQDFTRLGEWLRGEWMPPTQADAIKDYGLVSDTDKGVREMMQYIVGDCREWTWTPATDTETHGKDPWSMQFSVRPHSGRLIRVENKRALHAFQNWLADTRSEMILHHAGQDLDTLQRMGVAPVSFRDTMQEAYHQCHLPQGLKPLAFRLLGVTMRSWEDVVWPASVRAAISWIEDAINLASTGLQEIHSTPLKRGRCTDCGHQHSKGVCKCGCQSTRLTFKKTEYKPSGVEAVLKHVLTYTARTEEDDDPYNPWKKLPEMRVDGLRGKVAEPWEWEYVEEVLGPMPILGIGNCDLEEAVTYGCSDSDHTLQVADALEQGRGDKRWRVDAEDYDK